MSPRMRTIPSFAILAVVLLGASFAGDAPLRLATRAELTSGHDGSGAILEAPEGTPVVVLERSGDRVRVRVEGWIPASALPESIAEPAVPPQVPALAPVAVPAQGMGAAKAAAIEGTIRLDAKWMRKRKGAGARVWLLPPGTIAPDGDEEARLDALAAEMARLDSDAAKALEGSNFVDAMRKHDELVASRGRVKRERDDLVASLHGRHEALAQKTAIASAVADEQGFFRVEAAAGTYGLYARFLREGLDVEWNETASIGAGASNVGLDETNARHFAP